MSEIVSMNCPNCGAPVSGGVCAYCRSAYMSEPINPVGKLFKTEGEWSVQLTDLIGSRLRLVFEPENLVKISEQIGPYEASRVNEYTYDNRTGVLSVVKGENPRGSDMHITMLSEQRSGVFRAAVSYSLNADPTDVVDALVVRLKSS